MAEKILIIDDDKLTLQVVKLWLKNYDYEILTTVSGQEGLELAREETPHLILCDISMPEVNGYEVLKALRPDEACFWATHQGAELDLLLFVGGRRYGVEVKMQDAPVITPSMRIAFRDLGLQRLAVVYPGERRYSLDKNIDVVPLHDVADVISAASNRGKARGHGAGLSGRHALRAAWCADPRDGAIP